jgi:hypothetical protein
VTKQKSKKKMQNKSKMTIQDFINKGKYELENYVNVINQLKEECKKDYCAETLCLKEGKKIKF